MASTNQTSIYKLPIFLEDDKPSWLTDWNTAMLKIEDAIQAAIAGGTPDIFQEKLTSGVNIKNIAGQPIMGEGDIPFKTINGVSIQGEGNIQIEGGGSSLPEDQLTKISNLPLAVVEGTEVSEITENSVKLHLDTKDLVSGGKSVQEIELPVAKGKTMGGDIDNPTTIPGNAGIIDAEDAEIIENGKYVRFINNIEFINNKYGDTQAENKGVWVDLHSRSLFYPNDSPLDRHFPNASSDKYGAMSPEHWNKVENLANIKTIGNGLTLNNNGVLSSQSSGGLKYIGQGYRNFTITGNASSNTIDLAFETGDNNGSHSFIGLLSIYSPEKIPEPRIQVTSNIMQQMGQTKSNIFDLGAGYSSPQDNAVYSKTIFGQITFGNTEWTTIYLPFYHSNFASTITADVYLDLYLLN